MTLFDIAITQTETYTKLFTIEAADREQAEMIARNIVTTRAAGDLSTQAHTFEGSDQTYRVEEAS